MKTLTWTDALSVQVKEIDDDHRKLVDLYNILGGAVAGGEASEYIAAILDELIACTQWHFKHEERLMVRYGYHELSEHRAEHEGLVDDVKALQARLAQDGKPLADDELLYLERWLAEHILVADMKLGAFLGEVM